VTGIPTTRELAIEVLRSEQFASGRYSTSFLEESGTRLAVARE
jgi:biotin carboxylase